MMPSAPTRKALRTTVSCIPRNELVTPKPRTAQELTLCWGVQSWVTPEFTSTESMIESVQDALKSTGWVVPGDLIVIVAGNPARMGGQTNAVRIYELHD